MSRAPRPKGRGPFRGILMKRSNEIKKKVVYAGDMVPLSFSDYLGEPACVIFLAGCNFDCGYCQNWQLKRASEDNLTDLDRIKKVLSENKLVTACKGSLSCSSMLL